MYYNDEDAPLLQELNNKGMVHPFRNTGDNVQAGYLRFFDYWRDTLFISFLLRGEDYD